MTSRIPSIAVMRVDVCPGFLKRRRLLAWYTGPSWVFFFVCFLDHGRYYSLLFVSSQISKIFHSQTVFDWRANVPVWIICPTPGLTLACALFIVAFQRYTNGLRTMHVLSFRQLLLRSCRLTRQVQCIAGMHLVRRLRSACVRIDYKIERQHLDIVVVVDTKLYFCCVELLLILLCVESVEPHTRYTVIILVAYIIIITCRRHPRVAI